MDTDRLRGMRKEDMSREQRLALANRQMEDSSAASVRLVYETMDMAKDTTEELERQAESLDRTEAHLDRMDVDLEHSRRSMRDVKSLWGSFTNHLTKPKFSKEPKPKRSATSTSSDSRKKGGAEKKGSAQAQKQAANESTGNEIVDRNLDELEFGLRQLQGQAYLIGSQLDESEVQVDRIKTKMERNDIRIRKVTRDIRGQL